MDTLPIEILRSFPDCGIPDLDARVLEALKRLNKKIVVLDDDPTGVQTVHDIFVYTAWDESVLTEGFLSDEPIFFILTNSRGFTKEETARVHETIGKTLSKVSGQTGIDYVLISRSDSTMRGHYPLETETLRSAIERSSSKRFDGEILCPFFKEGGRYTIGNVHYVKDGVALVPAGMTEFARDKSFGYRSSHIGEYIEEKTSGRYKKDSCTYIDLSDLRAGAVQKISAQLMAVKNFDKVVLNAVDYEDVKVFALAFVDAVLKGKVFLFRSAAAVTKVLGGVSDAPLLSKAQLVQAGDAHGGIVLVGSHVNKTTQQLDALRSAKVPLSFLEFDQHLVLVEHGLDKEVERIVGLVEKNILQGTNVVVYTRRERLDLDTDDKDAQLRISTEISDAVTSIIGKLDVRPRFIIAKGGITSSDVGTKALRVKKALVMGQIKPGIPVWRTGTESKFPNMPYIIFPGNVGEVTTLKEIVDSLA